MQITIGIPSYNEEKSIRSLLEVLEQQITDSDHTIGEIIISDDSTDATPDRVNDFARSSKLNITLIQHNKRIGVAGAWNEIFRNAKGDAIVLYDADVLPSKNTTLLLASNIRDDTALCASNPMPIRKNNGIAAKASSFNALWLRRVRKHGLSQYTVIGRALSIRADIAKMVTVPDVIAIDLYLQCKVLELGYKINYSDDAVVWFKPTDTMLDFSSQVVRAIQGHSQIKKYVERFDIKLPLSLVIKETLKEASRVPKGMMAAAVAYCTLPLYISSIAKHLKTSSWHVADSTKGISVSDLSNQ
ncbi:MAG: glycosyltransferase [Nitrososphaerales archaeon]